MAPQFSFMKRKNSVLRYKDLPRLINEVLRCNAYLDDTVFMNCIFVLDEQKKAADKTNVLMYKMRMAAVLYHNTNNCEKRTVLKSIAKHLMGQMKLNSTILSREIVLFADSMEDPTSNSSPLPDLSKSINRNDLVKCYFLRELSAGNWENICYLVRKYDYIDPLEYSNQILKAAQNNNKATKRNVLDFFFECGMDRNSYFIEETTFEKEYSQIFRFCGAKIEMVHSNDPLITSEKEKFVSKNDLNKIIDAMDAAIGRINEGLVKTEEVNKAVQFVKEWAKKVKSKNGEGVVVVDSLNYGGGVDPVEWNQLEHEYSEVFFASRKPPKRNYDRVVKRYNGRALFCDKLSADDLIVLRMAWEFGPKARVVTNDLYKDHRKELCGDDKKLLKIWDDWAIDAFYRHDFSSVEARRRFNIRIRQLPDSSWLVPVLSNSPQIRNLNFYRISPPSDSS